MAAIQGMYSLLVPLVFLFSSCVVCTRGFVVFGKCGPLQATRPSRLSAQQAKSKPKSTPITRRLQSIRHRLSIPFASMDEVSDDIRAFFEPEVIERNTPYILDFMKRKALYEAGEGPLFPESSICECCNGSGEAPCPNCKGSGKNLVDSHLEENASIQCGSKWDAKWMLKKGQVCWCCIGKKILSCTECEGSGIRGGVTRLTAGMD
mmetsp:Transcript_10728/g.19561  ORF Transcript_10728/g.19561 Transcript_10728/m.19561 type:complete len:206 (-) Transcript_10728:243-860(-)